MESSSSATPAPARRELPVAAWSVLLACVAVLVGLCGAGRPSAWTDEVATLVAVRRSMPDLAGLLRHMDLVHGAWYVVVRAWAAVFGDSVVAVRILSAVFEGGATAGAVVLGALLAGRRLALSAGFVMLVLPVSTGAAIEARSEAFVTALATWTAVALVLAIRERRPLWWILYACGTVVAALAFVQSLTLVVAHALVLLVIRPGRQVWRGFGLAIGCALVVLTPFVVLAGRQRGQIGWVAAPTPWDVARALGVHEWFGGHAAFAAPAWLAMAAVVLLPRRFPLAWRSAPVPPAVLALAWAVVPNALVLVVSLAVTPMFVPRYLAYTAPAVALLVGVFLASLGLRWALATGAALALLGAWSVAQAWSVDAKDNSDWSTAAEVAAAQRASCGAVVFVPDDGTPRSPRRARDAYPSQFAGLSDVGLAVRGSEHGQLFDTGRPVSPAAVERGACTVGLVSLRETSLDDAASGLAAEGWSSADVVWRGPSTVVLRLSTSG